MDCLVWHRAPDGLREPVLVVAFEGWNDAGDAATRAVDVLVERWDAEPLAAIDPEEFYDFTTTRPMIEIDEEGIRTIRWPENMASVATIPGTTRDVILLRGVEPQLRWRSFSAQIVQLARRVGARAVITLGALLAEVPHSRPVVVYGTSDDATLGSDLHLEPSSYEGPTGIVGVLQHATTSAGFSSASLWATVPSYVPGATSPKGTLALLDRLGHLLDTSLVTTDLEIAAASYERQVSELVAEDDETAGYVRDLEEQFDVAHDDDAVIDLVSEVEQYLRDQPS